MTSPETPEGGDAAAVLERLAAERYSCRGFRSDPVPRATLERVLAIAQRSASWCNAQPWQIVIGSPAATERARDALLEYVQRHPPKPDLDWPREYRGIYRERRRECGLQLYRATGVARGDHAAAERQRNENFRFFGAPHVAVLSTEKPLGTYGAIDCGGYIAMFQLAARACGLASIALAALGAYAPFWREHWGLDPERRIVCGLAIGFEDPAHPANSFRTSRASLADAVRWVD